MFNLYVAGLNLFPLVLASYLDIQGDLLEGFLSSSELCAAHNEACERGYRRHKRTNWQELRFKILYYILYKFG